MTVTALSPDDWRVLRDVRLASLADSPEAFAADLAVERADDEPAWRARLAEDSWAVARRDGASVGVLAVSDPAPRDTADGWVHSWWIAPEARGREPRARCWRGPSELGRSRAWTRIGLGVWVENTSAIAAFAALGFVGQESRPSSRYGGRHYVEMVQDITEG